MSFEAVLTVAGADFALSQFYMTVRRDKDSKNRPSSKPEWTIACRFDVSDDTVIPHWMIDPRGAKDGHVNILKKGPGGGVLKKIAFSKAYCFNLEDFFDSSKGYGTVGIEIRGPEIDIHESKLTIQ